MRPSEVINSGPLNANTPWIPIDYLQMAFAAGLFVSFDTGASLTVTVQLTEDGPETSHPVTFSQTTTVITVTDLGLDQVNGHGLLVGDYVKLESTDAGIDGEYAVASVTSSTVYTLTSGISQSASDKGRTRAITCRVYAHASLATLTTRSNGSVAFPIRGVRLTCTVFTSGKARLKVLQGAGP